MTDLSPDLPRLRTLETWLAYALAEQRERERQYGIENRPPPPE